jgi:CDP-diacylglycerol---glycerol-3-phosphate 3-phosphatidyltransferase
VTGSFVSPATRRRVRDLATPIATALGRLGLTPNALTVIGFLGTCVAAFAAANQSWLAAGVLVLVFGIFDLFDGTLARATDRATKFGAFLDSTFDRAGEAIVYSGIAIGSLAGGLPLGAVLAATAMGASFMVSYTRAKAEGLGFASGTGLANIGLAPREVRLAILAAGLIVTQLAGAFVLAPPCSETAPGQLTCIFALYASMPLTGSTILATALALITVLATLTTIQRILHVRAQSREG